MEENKRSTGRGCLKALGIGCLTVVVAVLAAVILVWINWDKIQESGWYHSMTGMAESAKAEMGNMMMLQKSLMTEYPAEGVSVQARGQSGSNGATKSLVVNFVNPKFQVDDSSIGKEGKAREIALSVAGQYPRVERYDFVTVSFTAQKGVGVTFKMATNHSFSTAELLAEINS